jgi:2-hydroxychromene-2-carboxylate isomerase
MASITSAAVPGEIMAVAVEAFYDFRSPYAHFAVHRIREGLFVSLVSVEWLWRPVSVDILLNLQAGRDAWADYVDPLSAPKRKHLMADVRRTAEFYGAALRPPHPPRQNSIAALCVAAMLEAHAHEVFRNSIFDALWQKQTDIANIDTLKACLAQAGKAPEILNEALSSAARTKLATCTEQAYARGIFGVPSFVCDGEILFGNDRLDMLAWRLGSKRTGP